MPAVKPGESEKDYAEHAKHKSDFGLAAKVAENDGLVRELGLALRGSPSEEKAKLKEPA